MTPFCPSTKPDNAAQVRQDAAGLAGRVAAILLARRREGALPHLSGVSVFRSVPFAGIAGISSAVALLTVAAPGRACLSSR